MDPTVGDFLPFSNSTGAPPPRFPGDRGRGADIPLDLLPRPMDMAAPNVDLLLRQRKPSRFGPRMPKDVKPPTVQRTSMASPLDPDYSNVPPPPGYTGASAGGDFSAVPPPPGPLAPPTAGRTGILGTLLGPGGQESREKGGVTLGAALTRALGGSEESARGAGQFEQSLQRALAMPGGQVTAGAPAVLPLLAKGVQKAPMIARGVLGAGSGALEGVSQGEDAANIGKRAGAGALFTGAGEVASKMAAPLLSPLRHKLFSAQSADQVADWLRTQVPAWKDMKGPRALYEMAREGGQGKLSDAYAQAWSEAAKTLPEGATFNISAEAAKKTGLLKGALPSLDAAGEVAVDARRLIAAIPGLGKRNPQLRQEILDSLPEGTVPDAVFKEYKTGKGWMDFAKKSGLFNKGEKFDISLAVEQLRKHGKETMEGRGMGDLRKIMRGPAEREPIKKTTMAGPLALAGGAAGGLGGGGLGALLGPLGVLGGVSGGMAGGARLGQVLGQRMPVYKNVPEVAPQVAQIRRALMQALGQQVVSTGSTE